MLKKICLIIFKWPFNCFDSKFDKFSSNFFGRLTIADLGCAANQYGGESTVLHKELI